jgi:alkylation response protein AidB-like acyl-CoA dehydrogenase
MSTPTLDPTAREIVEALAHFLAKEAPLARSLQASETADGFDREAFQGLAELGFFGVTSDAAVGGLELAPGVRGAFCVEAGRVLLGGPWLEQLLAASLLVSPVQRDLLEAVIGGSTTVSVPLAAGAWARPAAAEVVDGDARFVGGTCELGFAPAVDGWLVPARAERSGEVVLVHLAADADRATARRRWSDVWQSHDVELGGAEGAVVARLDAAAVAATGLDVARLLASVAVGASEAVLDLTVDFLGGRVQFGRPLGSFQALQHRMADVYIDLEHTRSLVRAAAASVGADDEVRAVMAKVAADRLGVTAAQSALQAHGGLGFTWELPVHHYLKEALRRRSLPQPTSSYELELRRSVVEYRI